MKIVFLEVGEAFDENYPNNSILILSEKTSLMIDCGDSAVRQLWKFNKGDHNLVDALYITHRHSDHFFGLPAMLSRMLEEKRIKPFTIICQKGLKDSFLDFMDFAYKDFQKKFKYKINLVESKKEENVKFNDLELSFSPTVHSGENLAIKITDGKNVMAYSGDGSPITDSDFYKDLDILILETYLYDEEIIDHSSIVSGISFAENNNVKCLALTHINRDFRKNDLPNIKDKIISDKVKIIIPEPLDEYNL